MSETPIYDALVAGIRPVRAPNAPEYPVRVQELISELEVCAFFADGTRGGVLVPLAHFMRERIAGALREAGAMLDATQRVEHGDTAGVALIAEERHRQISPLGHDPDSDIGSAHDLIKAAQSYVSCALYGPDGSHDRHGPVPPAEWPWSADAWTPDEDPRLSLAKAGACIAAAIDSLHHPLKGRTPAQRRDEHLVRRVTT